MTIETLLAPMDLAMLKEERQEGRQEGLLRGLRWSILDGLEARFGPLPVDVQLRIHGLKEETVLRRAHHLAIVSPSVDQFREDLADYERWERPMTIETLVSPMELALLKKERREGRQEGLLQGLRSSILDALEARFGPLPLEAQERLQKLQEETALRRAHRLATATPSLDHFLQTVVSKEGKALCEQPQA